MNDDTDNETDIRPASPTLRVHFFILEEGKGHFDYSLNSKTHFVFEGEEGSQRHMDLKIQEVKLNEDQPGWRRRDVASVLLDRLGEELEEPETLSDFNKIATLVEREVAEGPVLEERGGPDGPRAKSGARSLLILRRHEDGWMIEDSAPVVFEELETGR